MLAIPSYLIIKDIQNDMPLREYVKETLLRRLKTDFKRFFTFSDESSINIPVLYLEISEPELKKLEEMRVNRLAEIDSHKVVHMGQEHWDFVKANIIYEKTEYQIKIRIRGDMPSNYNRGIEKASFRFNVESDNALFGKKKLSIVRAFLENNFYGYLFSKYMDNEGFVTNDVMFVRLIFNGEDTGICFLQEGFSKELAESSDYREGVIFRFKNDCIDNNGDYNSSGIPELVPYNEKRILKDSVLNKQCNRALTKFDLLKTKKILTAQCFNTEKFAKYLALCDIFLAHHSYVCHNAKLYFNPVNDKFEPIAWDPSSFMRYNVKLSVQRGFNSVSGEIYNDKKSYPIYQWLFSDTLFLKNFNRNLFEYSSGNSIAQFVEQYKKIIDIIDPVLYRQRFQEQFKPEILLGNIETINHSFSTENRFTAKIFRNEGILVVNSMLPLAVHLSKLKLDSANIIFLDKILYPFQSDTFRIAANLISPNDKKFMLFSSVFGFEDGQKYKGNIFEKMDQYNTPVISETTDSSLFNFDTKNKKLSFKSKNITIEKSIYIPPGFTLNIEGGSEINLKNSSSIISESAFDAKGKSDKKIKIHSDGTGGIFIKNAKSSSYFEYVQFENLSNPQSNNWSLTGAVTFYETEIFFDNCIFKNNFSEDALNIIRSKFNIQNCFVSHTSSDAIDIDFSDGKIMNTVIENTKNDGLDFSASHVELKNIKLSQIGDKAVSGGENSFADLQNINISDSFIGISSKDKSTIKSENITIENTKYPLTSYQKKPEYGPATIIVNQFKGNSEFLIEKNSVLILDGDTINGSVKNIYEKLYSQN